MTTLSDTTPSILPPTAAQPAKKRLPYIDTAKGILMICLLYGHMHIYAEMVGYHNEGMKLMQQLVPLYASFFMQTFFVITGYCSTFRIGLKPYVWKNAKTLILPAVVLGIVGSVCDLPFDGVKPPEELLADAGDYFYTGSHGVFTRRVSGTMYDYMNWNTRRLYRVDVATKACQEVPLHFDLEEVRAHDAGFDRLTEWLQYGCEENALHTLPELLDGRLPGKPYDADAERAAYGESAANVGTCGEKIYAWLRHVNLMDFMRTGSEF